MEGKRTSLATPAIRLYGRLRAEKFRSKIRALLLFLEGGPLLSLSVREILRRFQKVEIGLFTEWPHTEKPGVFHPGTQIGRYCSVASTVRTFTRNHPMNVKSTHGFFENPALGKAKADLMDFGTLIIGDGVIMGHNALVLRPTERIGEGAIIAPGSVVYSNIPPYAIASGFPARVTGYRFPKEVIAHLIASQWHRKSPQELDRLGSSLIQPPQPTSDSQPGTASQSATGAAPQPLSSPPISGSRS